MFNEFREFRDKLNEHVDKMVEDSAVLYIATVDVHKLWETYLGSFPAGTNEVYRTRSEHDCGCCETFIRQFGSMVTIDSGKIVTIWDFDTGSATYQPVVDAMSELVSRLIDNVFVTKQALFGVEKSLQQVGEAVQTWNHFYFKLPDAFVTRSSESEEALAARFRDAKHVFERGLIELTEASIMDVLDMVEERAIHKGDEWKVILHKFLDLHRAYHSLPSEEKDNFVWAQSVTVPGSLAKIRNTVIGSLLIDLSAGMDATSAVARYHSATDSTNYMRPKEVFTQAQVKSARDTVAALGLGDSLGRRFAVMSDITVNDILFRDRSLTQRMNTEQDAFGELSKHATKPRNYGNVEVIGIDEFIKDVLPGATRCEVLVEDRHKPNLVSLIAPKEKGAPALTKWKNGFGWAYAGNLTDVSMKEQIKERGGKVDGVLRFSIRWNEENDNQNDYDAHCIEPHGEHIFFNNKRSTAGGTLDVDIISPNKNTAVENITWASTSRMAEGVYEFFVHNFSDHGGRNGFRAEIEYNAQVFSFSHPRSFKGNAKVAKIRYTKERGFEMVESIQIGSSVYSMKTNEFQSVSVILLSPNHWDGEAGIGSKHYFFMLPDAINGETPNGFYNEFLPAALTEQKHVFAALGSQMRVEPSADQLTGLGFSATMRNSMVARVNGRVFNLVF